VIALPLSLGDFILIEIALAQFLKGMDLSMQAGQQMANVIGKIEYQIGELTQAAGQQGNAGLKAPE